MDPLTQGLLGASLPLSLKRQTSARWAAFCGFIGGLAPDLDTLIRSDLDPLLYLEYHRQFSHSLSFIPLGGLLCALLIYLILKRFHGLSFGRVWLYCTLGYATHGLLDAATSYGTQLLWPFSDYRVAAQIISIIDPLFTLPLLLFCALSFAKRTRKWMLVGLGYCLIYMTLGLIQHNRALEAAQDLATHRGHHAQETSVKPSFGNLILWKSIYEHQGRYYVDAIHLSLKTKIYEGDSLKKMPSRPTDLGHMPPEHQQMTDIERFRHFSNGYIAQSPQDPRRIIDVRYSLLPNRIDPLWYITLDPSAPTDQHARFIETRKPIAEQRQHFWQMLKGADLGGD